MLPYVYLLGFYFMLAFMLGYSELCCYATCVLRCSAVFQRASVQVLTQFKAHDPEGRITHLMGSSDWMVDVTELVSDSLIVEDPQVAFLGEQNNLIGLEPGKTTLQVRTICI